MSKARLIITAVTVENRPVAEVVADYGVSRSWVYELLARYRAEGDAAFQPRSKRPHTSAAANPAATVDPVLRLRKQLVDAGPSSRETATPLSPPNARSHKSRAAPRGTVVTRRGAHHLVPGLG